MLAIIEIGKFALSQSRASLEGAIGFLGICVVISAIIRGILNK